MWVRHYPNLGGSAASTYQTTIVLSVGPNGPTSTSATFADNHGVKTTVFSGAVSLPTFGGGSWPTPWESAIPFSQVFPYSASAGQSLVVEFTTTDSTSKLPWRLEGYSMEKGFGDTEHVQLQCFNSAGRTSLQASLSNGLSLVPGGTLSHSLRSYPRNTPSLAINALLIGTEGLGASIGPFTREADLWPHLI